MEDSLISTDIKSHNS